MISCFEGCYLEGKRCEDMELSSRGVFASFEALALEALTDMHYSTFSSVLIQVQQHTQAPKQVGREGEGDAHIRL